MITVKLQQITTLQDVEVLVKYREMNQSIKRLVTLIRSTDSKVACTLEDKEIILPACDIYYIESVDKKTFIYSEKEVHRSSLKLYQLGTELAHAGFVQISKSCILNMEFLMQIKSLANSRLEALLSNGEKLTVSRKYIKNIKEKLAGGIL